MELDGQHYLCSTTLSALGLALSVTAVVIT